MKYRAKITNIRSTLKAFYRLENETIVNDQTEDYLEVDTEQEAELLEKLNTLEWERFITTTALRDAIKHK